MILLSIENMKIIIWQQWERGHEEVVWKRKKKTIEHGFVFANFILYGLKYTIRLWIMTCFCFLRSRCAHGSFELILCWAWKTWFLIYQAIRMCEGSLCDMTTPIIYIINPAGRSVSSTTSLFSSQRAQPWPGNAFLFKFMYWLNYIFKQFSSVPYSNSKSKKYGTSNQMHYFVCM